MDQGKPEIVDALADRIVEAGRAELRRRASHEQRIDRSWSRLPTAAASLVALLLAGVILFDRTEEAPPAPIDAEVVLPREFAAWLVADYPMEPLEALASLRRSGAISP